MSKTKKIILVVVVAVVALVGGAFALRHTHEYLDKVNPLVPESLSYARLPAGAREIQGAEVIDSNGDPVGYPLDFTAYNDNGGLVAIVHKGTYVMSLDTDPLVPQPVRERLGD